MNCPECKSKKTTRNGTKMSRKGRVQRWQCQSCGRVFQAKATATKGSKKC